MKVLVSGGGTGGHIYPAIALIKQIKKKNAEAEFLYVGTQKGLESKIVPEENVSFQTIEIQGFKRSLTLKNVKTVYLFLKSISESKKIIQEFKPDIVIGTGGYVCASVVYAAHKCGVPTIIHEQNSVPGITNKFLAKYVDKIAICFPEAAAFFPKEKVIFTGNPRAQEVVGIEASDILTTYGLKSNKPTVLVFGGSRGALTITQGMIEAIPLLKDKNYQVLYGTGDVYQKMVMEKVNVNELSTIKIVPYIPNMTDILANVDLVISRAGATTLAELTALGIPSILVPSPNVTNDHQTKNAMSLVNVGAAMLIKDDQFNGTNIAKQIDTIMLDKSVQQKMSKAAKDAGIPDASDRLIAVMEEIM